MKLTVAGSATAVFALVAMATAPQAAASPEDEFLDALASANITYPEEMTSQVINSGYAVCRGWDSGEFLADVTGAVIDSSGLGQRDARVVVRAATKAFCPQYSSRAR